MSQYRLADRIGRGRLAGAGDRGPRRVVGGLLRVRAAGAARDGRRVVMGEPARRRPPAPVPGVLQAVVAFFSPLTEFLRRKARSW